MKVWSRKPAITVKTYLEGGNKEEGWGTDRMSTVAVSERSSSSRRLPQIRQVIPKGANHISVSTHLMMTASRMTKKSTTILALSPNCDITIPKPVQNTIIPRREYKEKVDKVTQYIGSGRGGDDLFHDHLLAHIPGHLGPFHGVRGLHPLVGGLDDILGKHIPDEVEERVQRGDIRVRWVLRYEAGFNRGISWVDGDHQEDSQLK